MFIGCNIPITHVLFLRTATLAKTPGGHPSDSDLQDAVLRDDDGGDLHEPDKEQPGTE